MNSDLKNLKNLLIDFRRMNINIFLKNERLAIDLVIKFMIDLIERNS